MFTHGKRHRRAVVLAVAATLAAGSLSGCTQGAPDAAADPAARADLRVFYHQKPQWKPCGEEECATLKVPMDYSAAGNGKTFTLPLVRATATDTARRIGSLVFNPGGPGESGVALLKDGGAESFSEQIRARFDIVGFDPRGVAGSKPAVDCGPDEEGGADTQAGDVSPQPLHPATAEQRRAALADAESAVAACKRYSGSILPHVGTADAARDMDVLRAALGEDKLSYLGWSYGTSLGTTYGELFPWRVRAMVLDGAVDPSLDWSERALSQAAGFRKAVDDYAEHCADVVGDACPADTPEGIRELLDGLYEQTAKEPLPVDDSDGGLDAATLHSAIVTSMYTPEEQWKPLSHGLSDAAGGDGTRLAGIAAGEEDASEDEDTGSDDEEEQGEKSHPDNSDVAITAVDCVDIPHPRDSQKYWQALDQAHRAEGDYGSESVVAALGCKGWPHRGPGPHRVSADGLPPVLVVGTTGDPSTPYHEAESLARQLPQGMLLTFEGLGHTAYGRGGSCVDTAVDSYLIDLKPVKPGATC
ncbi:alpha/beta hydrolase [Streptomyces sp. CB03234]|uniref:alpha/beta hydrolase n=1 Tax=Streptomyces sp. (strain CB03234) TaxID=1703937 RepID=UPI000B21810B|nr:alpha/beta hydrolase [Streptomyces sp. CB03234]